MTEKQLRYMRAFILNSSEFVIDDNATHERLKRYSIVDRLNEQHELIEYLKPLANENTQYIADMEDDIATFKEEIQELKSSNMEMEDYCARLEEQLENCKNKFNHLMRYGVRE